MVIAGLVTDDGEEPAARCVAAGEGPVDLGEVAFVTEGRSTEVHINLRVRDPQCIPLRITVLSRVCTSVSA